MVKYFIYGTEKETGCKTPAERRKEKSHSNLHERKESQAFSERNFSNLKKILSMKFISVCIKDSDLEIVHINFNHIVKITTYTVMHDDEKYTDYAAILLSNGEEIICEETPSEIK